MKLGAKRCSIGTTAVLVLLGAVGTGMVMSKQEKVIRAQRIEVLSPDGETQMILDGSSGEGAELRVVGESGRQRLRLHASGEGAMLRLGPAWDEKSREPALTLFAQRDMSGIRAGREGEWGSWILTAEPGRAFFELSSELGGVRMAAGERSVGIKLTKRRGEDIEIGAVKK